MACLFDIGVIYVWLTNILRSIWWFQLYLLSSIWPDNVEFEWLMKSRAWFGWNVRFIMDIASIYKIITVPILYSETL